MPQQTVLGASSAPQSAQSEQSSFAYLYTSQVPSEQQRASKGTDIALKFALVAVWAFAIAVVAVFMKPLAEFAGWRFPWLKKTATNRNVNHK